MGREIGPRDIAAYLAVRDHAADLGIDVIHGHGAKGGAYSRLVARAMKRAGRTDRQLLHAAWRQPALSPRDA